MTMNQNITYRVAIAGTTNNTVKCVLGLLKEPSFELSWILTPQPKKTGRKQKLVKNPVHKFAQKNKITTFFVNQKINQDLKDEILNFSQKQPIDFLLVVDFGYIVPSWLLQLPKIAPLNIHPSKLPRWRGSSPGQFVLLAGEKKSAVSLIKMNQRLDQGPIISQLVFKVKSDWTQQEYYDHSFKLISDNLAGLIKKYTQGKLAAEKQPLKSPTPIARRLSKKDAFISWDLLKSIRNQITQPTLSLKNFPKNSLLKKFLKKENANHWPQIIEQASRAFQPWPILWTKLPTKNGQKRMQIFSCDVTGPKEKQALQLNEVKIAGQTKAKWNQVKNIVT